MARGILNSIAIDTDGEDYDYKQLNLSGVKDVIDTSCNMLSAVTEIPQTILFGKSPDGMNATGESDMENYYNYIERIQTRMVKSNLRYLLSIIFQAGVHSGDSISVYPSYSLSKKVKDTILDYTVKLGLGCKIIGLFNIQFIVDQEENVYIIEVNPRSSRTVPFLSKATGYSLADIGTKVILGEKLKDLGITEVYPKEKERWYVKCPAFSFSKLKGLDVYLSPEMKSTGEAIGYDSKLNRAMYKALQAAGNKLSQYGTVFVTIANKDKEEAFPLIKRFYDLGFNIEATEGTANFLKERGIRTRIKRKLKDGYTDILDSIRSGYITYVINTRDASQADVASDGYQIRQCAVENNIATFTALDTVRVLLDVLEETTMSVSTIDA